MGNLREHLRLGGRVCLIGIGNVDRGDDGFGVRLARALRLCPAFRHTVIVAGMDPEGALASVRHARFDHVVFLDAVDFGGGAGETVFLDANGITSRFPQVSTHRLSLGVFARMLEAGGTRAWLLGVQPQSVAEGEGLTPLVQASFELLRELLIETYSEVVA